MVDFVDELHSFLGVFCLEIQKCMIKRIVFVGTYLRKGKSALAWNTRAGWMVDRIIDELDMVMPDRDFEIVRTVLHDDFPKEPEMADWSSIFKVWRSQAEAGGVLQSEILVVCLGKYVFRQVTDVDCGWSGPVVELGPGGVARKEDKEDDYVDYSVADIRRKLKEWEGGHG